MPRLWKLELQMKLTLLGFLLVLVFAASSCSRTERLCSFTVNPDISCRVCDSDKNGRKLIEFFDRDANELRLFISTQSSDDEEIVHPHGQVVQFYSEVNRNLIKFDTTDPAFIIVNGEKLLIRPK
jgi:hypothetical protein